MARRKTPIIFENIEVLDAGARGKTIAKAPDGRVIFLSNTVPGDIVDIRTGKQKKAYFEGTAIKFHKLSTKRTEPVCQHFEHCGGCKWQNMAYEHQIAYKEKEVTNNLKRIGHLDLPEITPILGCENIYYYRNKMEYSFSNSRWLTLDEINSKEEVDNKNACGFHISGMWDKILDIEKCHLQEEPSNQIRNFIKKYGIENELDFFNPREQSGLLRTIMLRIASTGEIMVVIQFFKEETAKREGLLNALSEEFPQITSLQYVINGKGNDTIYDQDILLFKGRDHIFEEMEGLKFKIGPKSFYQTNSVQAYELYKITRDFANLSGDEVVYDFYTGTGTIAQFVAKNAKKVIGVESVPDAIADAKLNAEFNNIKNVEFYAGDMKDVFNDAFIKKHGQPDVIITDPPRDGMHKNVVAKILEISPKRIVYVSCNSATQARDLELMKAQYNIVKTQAVDMFPQTFHVENVVLLELK
ncbi:23S rRNA (uracil(1939)-C(5))-methyltransferase RlmD [Lutibacter sp. HS1-25]|uniref:23S rRNA (uracil(1939)-C(5))-methyltransferase RlmD n=1 Tax=Lutibacter sp. HS1-25 TaxID=2485000 RepID=UPI0010130486|nr:23S rRNA (uracil(1939)-C(5))-methyltransferase RlmD [Lutibacter sp. HS1-25]RXP57063.1 23S rRNA (uracil(1939)-C(5))-methyltransferase RlmD [Lutibacter sp. HS1-25]